MVAVGVGIRYRGSHVRHDDFRGVAGVRGGMSRIPQRGIFWKPTQTIDHLPPVRLLDAAPFLKRKKEVIVVSLAFTTN